MMDSQSVTTTGGGGERGSDGAHHLKGRTRHLLVDTQGRILTVTVHPANVMDRDGGALLWPPEQMKASCPCLTHVWLDVGYHGQGKGHAWIEPPLPGSTQVVKPPPRRVLVAGDVEPTPRPAFTVLPRRGVVERTFAWLGQHRRLSKDDERVCETSETRM